MTNPPVYPTLPLALMVLSPKSPSWEGVLESLGSPVCGTTVEDAMTRVKSASRADRETPFIPSEYYSSGPTRTLPLCHQYSGSAKTAVRNLLPVYPGDSL